RPKARSRKSAKSKSRRVLIPFVEAIVPVVDLQAGRVEIVPLTGLLDI
ncbi:MAG: ribosome maturation factor RimM, partial [Cyanobacteria bacterium P01_D01_bin.128]